MKFKILTIAAIAALSAFCGIRTIELKEGTTTLGNFEVPYGPTKVIGYETMMVSSNDNGSTSLELGRSLKMNLDRMSVTTVVTTQKVISVLSVANDYAIDAAYYPSEGAEPNEFSVAFSNCYQNATKGVSLGTIGTIRTTFRPGAGTATLTEPTNYFVKCEIDGVFNWYTNFVWETGASNITLNGFSQSNKMISMGISRLVPPKNLMQTNKVANTTYITNRWKEAVSRTIPVQLTKPQMTTNGYAFVAVPDGTFVFVGDEMKCTTPIATNAPGRVRIVVSD